MSMFVLPTTGMALPLAILSDLNTRVTAKFVLTQKFELADPPITDENDIRLQHTINADAFIEFAYGSGKDRQITLFPTPHSKQILLRGVSINEVGMAKNHIETMQSLFSAIESLEIQLRELTGEDADDDNEDDTADAGADVSFDAEEDDSVAAEADDDTDEDDADDEDVATLDASVNEQAVEDIKIKIGEKSEKILNFLENIFAPKNLYVRDDAATQTAREAAKKAAAKKSSDDKKAAAPTVYYTEALDLPTWNKIMAGKLRETEGEVTEFADTLGRFADQVVLGFAEALDKGNRRHDAAQRVSENKSQAATTVMKQPATAPAA